ncbi:MAG: hypothetical protein Q9160_003343 [Pyrenula sp. 1 TL-2023]
MSLNHDQIIKMSKALKDFIPKIKQACDDLEIDTMVGNQRIDFQAIGNWTPPEYILERNARMPQFGMPPLVDDVRFGTLLFEVTRITGLQAYVSTLTLSPVRFSVNSITPGRMHPIQGGFNGSADVAYAPEEASIGEAAAEVDFGAQSSVITPSYVGPSSDGFALRYDSQGGLPQWLHSQGGPSLSEPFQGWHHHGDHTYGSDPHGQYARGGSFMGGHHQRGGFDMRNSDRGDFRDGNSRGRSSHGGGGRASSFRRGGSRREGSRGKSFRGGMSREDHSQGI